MSDRRDVVYLYDGSFEGLLTAVFESYAAREVPIAIEENENVQEDFLYAYRVIQTDPKKAERVSRSVCTKIANRVWQNLYYAYLSDMPNKGRLCLDYVRAGYHFGPQVDLHLHIDCIYAVLDAGQRVRNEAHQYLGFVRFSELEGGIYYSEIEPKCHVLPVIASHFVRRLPQMPWMIHDTRRRLCLVYNGKSHYITPTDSVPKLQYSADENAYRKLWKTFYDTIEIRERHNERCRMNHMPKRFWSHLTELSEPGGKLRDFLHRKTAQENSCAVESPISLQ